MKEKNVKKIGIIVGAVLFVLCVAGLTYAYYQKLLFNDLNVSTITHGLDYYINYTKGQDITGSLEPTSDYTDGASAEVTFYKKDNTYDIYGHIYLDISEVGANLSNSNSLKYTIISNDTIVSEGSLYGVTTSSSKMLMIDIPLTTTLTKYKVYIWLDENDISNYNIENETLSASIRCEATMKPISAAGKITSLFTKTGTVTSNSISHDIDSTHQLIKDPAGNIRYYGTGITDTGGTYKEPNNYINIGDNVLWRIIGVFDGKLKLIRSTYIKSDNYVSGFSWDTSANTSSTNNGYGINEWSQADLMKLLNPGYENNQDLDNNGATITVNNSLWYNSQSGTCYNYSSNTTTSCNFTNSGLSESVKNKIADVTWNTGGWDITSVYPNLIYDKERGTTVISSPSDGITRTTAWTGKIGLAYPSDYGYATDLSQCNQNLYNYDYRGTNNTYPCRGNNWMWYTMTGATAASSSSLKYAWLLTPYSSYAYEAWSVYAGGPARNYLVCYAFAVSPVLYLSSEQAIESGSGTRIDPYVLSA